MEARVAIGFGSDTGSTLRENISALNAAIESGGGSVVPIEKANALVWLSLDGNLLRQQLAANADIEWVQLPWAGVETFARAGIFETSPRFSCAKGAFGAEVGEHAFFLILGCLRNAVTLARAKQWIYTSPVPHGVARKRVTVVGAGGIAEHLVPFLRAGGAFTTVVRRNNKPFEGADRTATFDELHDVLVTTDVLAICAPLTPETSGMIGAEQLQLMPRGSMLVNVGRGEIVDTEALVDALHNGHLHAAGLDVTDPEPLPDGHPLWGLDNVFITAHSADSDVACDEKLIERVAVNVRRFIAGDLPEGLIDKAVGY